MDTESFNSNFRIHKWLSSQSEDYFNKDKRLKLEAALEINESSMESEKRSHISERSSDHFAAFKKSRSVSSLDSIDTISFVPTFYGHRVDKYTDNLYIYHLGRVTTEENSKEFDGICPYIRAKVVIHKDNEEVKVKERDLAMKDVKLKKGIRESSIDITLAKGRFGDTIHDIDGFLQKKNAIDDNNVDIFNFTFLKL